MRTAYIVPSVIDIGDAPLNYTPVRSVFSREERLRQTVFTLASIDALAAPDSMIFVLDASPNPEPWRSILGYQKNLVFLNVRDVYPDIYETVRTHPNKTHAEALMFDAFLSQQADVRKFDYFVKVSGRYFLDGSFDPAVFRDPAKLYLKPERAFEWKECWRYPLVDRRAIQGDNTLRQYCAVAFAWGVGQFEMMRRLWADMATITHDSHYDIETLLYAMTRPYEADIVPVPWMCYGWGATNGTFYRY